MYQHEKYKVYKSFRFSIQYDRSDVIKMLVEVEREILQVTTRVALSSYGRRATPDKIYDCLN